MVILAIDDIAFIHGPLLAAVSQIHIFSALTAAMMSVLVIIGLISRSQGRMLCGVSWVGFGLFALYLINIWILFPHGH